MKKATRVSQITMPVIKAHFLRHNNGTLADWGQFLVDHQMKMLVVDEVDPRYPENIAWEILTQDEFISVYSFDQYQTGRRENNPFFTFVECIEHGFNPVTQCWRKILEYPDYEVNRQGFIRRLDDVDSPAIMQFKGRQTVDTEGWYAKLSLRGGKKHNVWLDNHIADHNLGEAEYKA